MRRIVVAAFLTLSFASISFTQEAARPGATPAAQPDLATQVRQLSQALRNEGQHTDQVQKEVDDLMWHVRLQDIAEVDKISIASSKPIRMQNPTGQGAGNPLIIYGYTFVPRRYEKETQCRRRRQILFGKGTSTAYGRESGS